MNDELIRKLNEPENLEKMPNLAPYYRQLLKEADERAKVKEQFLTGLEEFLKEQKTK